MSASNARGRSKRCRPDPGNRSTNSSPRAAHMDQSRVDYVPAELQSRALGTNRRRCWASSIRPDRPEKRRGAGTGGGSGIRTHDTVSRIHAFQASAFSHSAIPPHRDAAAKQALYIAAPRGVTSKRPGGHVVAVQDNPRWEYRVARSSRATTTHGVAVPRRAAAAAPCGHH
jgi:hypothetical protein